MFAPQRLVEPPPPPAFISLRWRILVPFALLMVVLMSVVYAAGGASSTASAHLQRLMVTSAAAAIGIAIALVVEWTIVRLERVTRVVDALADGAEDARVLARETDEIGELGAAVNRYAEGVRTRTDALHGELRRQRREISHLTQVLETLPDGVVVQDDRGDVLFTNEAARVLLGRTEGAENAASLIGPLSAKLGEPIAPGLYALGNPREVERGGVFVRAQAAALVAQTGARVGAVVLLRDITPEVRRERAQERVLRQMERYTAAAPARSGGSAGGLSGDLAFDQFAREMQRNAIGLQRMIVEMREIAGAAAGLPAGRAHRAIGLETLVWSVANEWRQIAGAAEVRLDIEIGVRGLVVRGDERRLRWAIGNLMDNAVKYTAPGGACSLEIRGAEDGFALLRVRDNGAGISREDLPHIFTRFFRGTPRRPDGEAVLVPGSGQGLATARHIVEAHGGRIRVKSSPGVGTAVYFSLPLDAAPKTGEDTHGMLPLLNEDPDGETTPL
jgi:two-component system phosphate regulon sensor histidine kinase PhoR